MEEYFLQSTRDGSDRSAEIEEKLTLYGVCILGRVFFMSRVSKCPIIPLVAEWRSASTVAPP